MSMMDQAMLEQRPSFAPVSTGLLQRKCDKCRKKKQFLQRRPAGQTETAGHTFLEPKFGHDFSKLDVRPKLAISQPDDLYEKEADQVADNIMRSAELNYSSSLPKIQRQSDEERYARPSPFCSQVGLYECEDRGCSQFGRACEPIEQGTMKGCRCVRTSIPSSEEETVQTKTASGTIQRETPQFESALNSVRRGGQPLSPLIRAFFEPRFGYDFSQVRVHNDVGAAESARAVNALAYTAGRDIVFGTGQYMPETTAGKHLLAHELAHVVQQTGGSAPN
jgi:hypothetical protein